MRLVLLTVITMCAFASNSLLTRAAVDGGHIDPVTFAVLRVMAGAVILAALVLGQGGRLPLNTRGTIIGSVSLAVYMIGFSLAYVTLDAGLGALILFGVVQITMFLFAGLRSTQPTLRQVSGAVIAFLGLIVALWPAGETPVDVTGAAFMAAAGIGWAAYTICGKEAANPLAATAANFCLCLPILCVFLFPWLQSGTIWGCMLAIVCGAVTSGLGYALWYRVLPGLQQSTAAVVQLSVPVIAIVAGAVLLGERLTYGVILAAVLVIAGIGWAVTSRSAPRRRS